MDSGDSGHEAHRCDARGVRETRGTVDEGERRDGGAVEAEQVERLPGAIDVRCAAERGEGILHLDDDRQKREWTAAHQIAQRGVDLILADRVRARRSSHRRNRKRKHRERGAEDDQPTGPHPRASTLRSVLRSSRNGKAT